MTRTRWALSWIALGCLVAGCGQSPGTGDSGTTDVVQTDVSARGDAATDTDVPTGTDAAATDARADVAPSTDAGAFTALAPCNAPEDYRTGEAVAITLANTYDPPCLRVAVGAMVLMRGNIAHPLRSSSRGTRGNPIPDTSANAIVTFATPGFFPFYCYNHGSNDGTGMAGVVQVVP